MLIKRIIIVLLFGLALHGQNLTAAETHEIQTYRLEIAIDAPPEFIYPYLIEEDRISRWQRDDSVTVTFPRGIEPRVGKQIKIEMDVISHPMMLLEIIRLEPGRLVLTEFVDGVLAGDFAYILQRQPDGSTVFVHEMRIKPVGMIVTVVWEVYGKQMHRKKMWTFMQEIKKIVEEDWRKTKPETPASPQ